MARDTAVAPKERVNIVYRPAISEGSEDVELPLKLVVMGDFSGNRNENVLEERPVINVNKTNFDDVLHAHDVNLEFVVANTLSQEEGSELSVQLSIKSIQDFEPAQIAVQVPELAKLMELRRALTALKGPMGNVPAFRKVLQKVIADDDARNRLEEELKAR